MQIVRQALRLWGLSDAHATLVAARENQVYRVTAAGSDYALRLHRQGYRSNAELRSELQWMAHVSAAGLHVPTPVQATDGRLMHLVEGVQVDVLEWLAGDTLDRALERATPDERIQLFHALGCEMAKLHQASDAWTLPQGFTRCAWDRVGLLGETPLWGRFWDNPALSGQDKTLLADFRETANAHLTQLADSSDYGLIHADLVSANVMVHGQDLHLIDFDDGGFGYRMFDVTTALLKHLRAPDYPALQEALFDGYRTLRPLDAKPFNLFMALRAVTYVGWNITRMTEENGVSRNGRFISTAKDLISTYLTAPVGD